MLLSCSRVIWSSSNERVCQTYSLRSGTSPFKVQLKYSSCWGRMCAWFPLVQDHLLNFLLNFKVQLQFSCCRGRMCAWSLSEVSLTITFRAFCCRSFQISNTGFALKNFFLGYILLEYFSYLLEIKDRIFWSAWIPFLVGKCSNNSTYSEAA